VRCGARPHGSITADGLALVDVAGRFERDLKTVLGDPSDENALNRHLIVSSVSFLIEDFMAKELTRLRDGSHGLTVSFIATNQHVSLAYGEADISVQMHRPTEGRLVGQKIGALEMCVSGTREPTTKEWIGLSEEFHWTPEMALGHRYFGCPPCLRMNDFQSMAKAALSTGLPMVGPKIHLQTYPGLTHFLPEDASVEREIWSVYHETRRRDPAVKLVGEWLKTCFAAINDVPLA